MADVLVTLKIMPESPETDLAAIEAKAKEEIEKVEGKVLTVTQEPVAFGLKSVNVEFSVDEDKGGTDPIEEAIRSADGIVSAEVISVTRALG